MKKIHTKLTEKYTAYKIWHEKLYHQHLHWLVFVVFSLSMTLSLVSSINKTEAASIIVGPSSGTSVSDNSNGGTLPWLTPENTATSNNQNATNSLTLASETTEYLKTTGFNFAVPTGSTITGIKVQIEKGKTCTGCTVIDDIVKLLKAGSVVGDNKALTSSTAWPSTGSGGSRYYGTASSTVDSASIDLWGTSWTAEEINNAGFGVVVSAKENSDVAASLIVDMIKITVYYDEPVGGGGGGGGGDVSPPAVFISAPDNLSTVSGTVNFTASASDNVGVVGVQLKVDGVNFGAEDLEAPYTSSWDTATASNGSHSLTATARDAAGNQATSAALSVTVSNGGGGGGGDTTPPTVSITAPTASATVSGTTTITATASDNVGVSGVQFKLDGTNLGVEDTTAPYTLSWDTTAASNASHSLTATARDAAGNQTTSTAVSVTVDNTAPPTGLIGYWNFNEGSGTTANDSSGNSNIGTLTNGPSWTTGKLGGGLNFDGVDDKVLVGDTASLDISTSALTLSAWIYTDGTDTRQFPYIMGKVNTTNNYVLYISNTAFSAALGVNAGNILTNCAKTSFTHNQWNLVTATYDGANISIYINGTLKGTCAKTGVMVPNNDPFIIGDKGNGVNNPNSFKGKIDEVRVYNRALSSSEITTLYNEVFVADIVAPSVSITAPTASATLSGATTITATASDNVGVSGVQFKLDGSNVGVEDTTDPYSYSWNTASATNGSHSITAVARDAAGNQTTSTAVSVTVNNIITTPPPANDNTVTVTEKAGVSTTNYPMQIGRPFVQGEIQNFPQVLINGVSVFTQADVKQRWSDGSVKHAVLSFLIPNFSANSSVTLSFQNQSSGNNTPLTSAEMLGSQYNFNATMDLTSGGITKTASARTMLQNGDYTLWTSGPVATTVILTDHSTIREYDLGFDSFKPFRPIFHATFWPTIDKVRVRYIGELANTEEFEDIALSSLTLKLGNISPTTPYTKSSFTMYAGSRWTKEFWLGGAPSLNATNFNLTYLAKTKFIPNYDPSKVVSENAMALHYATHFKAWLKMPRDLYDSGQLTKSMATTGGRAEIGPYPDWTVRWLYTGDYRMKESAFGNADLSAAWPIHFREGNVNKKMDKAKTIPGFGKIISISDRPSVFLSNMTHINNKVADKIKIVGSNTGESIGGWKPDMAHSFDIHSPIYTSTGDYWYLEELQFWTAYGVASGDGTGGVYPFRRGPTGAEGGLTGQLRGKAWLLRTRVNATFVTPDDTLEKSYFNDLINDAIAIDEGYKNITTTPFYQNANWTWARNFINQPLGNPKQNQWDAGEANSAQASYGIDETVTEKAVSGFSQDMMMFALGRAKELGYVTDNLVSYLSKFYIQGLINTDSNPYMMALGRFATVKLAGSQYFNSWVDLMTGYNAESRALTSFPLQDPVHGYDFMVLAATSMVTNEPGGAAAWDFVKTKILPASVLNDNPKWAILPRSVSDIPPPPPPTCPPVCPDITAPSVSTNLTSTATGSTVSLAWTASTDSVGVTGYKIFRNSIQIGTSAVASFLDNDPALAPLSDYSYSVSAYDAAGNNSTLSNSVVSSLLLKINTFIATPSIITVGQVTTLSWDISSADIISINQGVGTVTTLSGTGTKEVSPTANITYTLTATSDTKSVTKTVSVVVNPVIIPPVDPGDTTPPTITNVLANQTRWTRAFISWVTNELADSQVQYGLTTSYGNLTLINPLFLLNHGMPLKDLKPGKTYNFRVKSRDPSGNIKNSENFTFNTVARLLKPPKITLLVASEGSVKLGWQKVDYEDLCKSIDIYRNTTGFLTEPGAVNARVASLDCEQTAYIDTAVTFAKTYYYSFFVIDDENKVSDAGTVQFTTKADPNPGQGTTKDPTGGGGAEGPEGADIKSKDHDSVETVGCDTGAKFSSITGKPCAGSSSSVAGAKTYDFGPVTLRNGSRGKAVEELQRFLNDELNLGLKIDGILGPKTIAVIMQWQKANGLVSDGLIGPKTKILMNEIAAKRGMGGDSDDSGDGPRVYNFGTVTLRDGSRGETVKELQRFLNDVLGLGLVVDGKLGPKTIAVIKQWQEEHDLVPDGLIGPKTKAMMNESVAENF